MPHPQPDRRQDESQLTHISDDAMLNKYGLKADDAILAEEKHLGIYEDRECTLDT